MVLEFLSEADALNAFTFHGQDVFKRLREHPLFVEIEKEYTPIKGESIFSIGYNSGLENHYVTRFIKIKRYKNYVRLIPENDTYNWIAKELIDLFIPNKEYNIIV